MSDLIGKELRRWGFKFYEENYYEGYRVKLTKMDRKGELKVHEMISLEVQWVEGDITDRNDLTMPDVEFLIVLGMEGNEEVKAEDLPVMIVPKISYRHQVSCFVIQSFNSMPLCQGHTLHDGSNPWIRSCMGLPK